MSAANPFAADRLIEACRINSQVRLTTIPALAAHALQDQGSARHPRPPAALLGPLCLPGLPGFLPNSFFCCLLIHACVYTCNASVPSSSLHD